MSGSIEVSFTSDGTHYQTRAETTTRGLLDLLVGFGSRAKTAGRITAHVLRPTRHEADNVWRGETRWVHIVYGADGGVDAEVWPSAASDDRESVSPAETVGTIDPLTAALRVTGIGGTRDGCEGVIPVFDGRRRYDLVLERRDVAPDAGLPGPAVRCHVTLKRLAGFSRQSWLPVSEEDERATLWLARVEDALPPVPVRLEADSALGAVRVHLVKVDGVPLHALVH